MSEALFERKAYAYRRNGRFVSVHPGGLPFLMWAKPEPSHDQQPDIAVVRVIVSVSAVSKAKRALSTRRSAAQKNS
jgi:hypothetical protein